AWAQFRQKDFKALGTTLTTLREGQAELLFLAGTAHLHLSGGKNLLPLRRLWWREGAGPWGLAALRYLAQASRLYDARRRAAILRSSAPVGVGQGVVGDPCALLGGLRRRWPPRSDLRAEVSLAIARESMRRDPRRATALLSEVLPTARDAQLRR